MKESQTENLQLRVKNFGPIYRADIDLRPLTVFVGPSNTGKSYLATLVYTLHQYFGQGLSGLGSYRIITKPGHSRNKTALDEVEKLALEQLKRTIMESPANRSVVYPAVLINNQVKDERAFRTELCRSFGQKEVSSFFRWGDKRNKPSIVLEKKCQGNQTYRHAMDLKEDTVQVAASITKDLTMPVDVSEIAHALGSGFLDNAFDEEFDWAFFNLISRTVSQHLLPALHCSAFYLPAGRIGMMRSHRNVVLNLITEASRDGLQPAHKMPDMSGVETDFFKHLVQMDPRQGQVARKKLKFNSVWKEVEKKILKGEVNVVFNNPVANFPLFTYRPHGWRLHGGLPLVHASSTVSELASFVLFLKYLVQPGDLMIIEEPEAHLYPDMQVEFLGQLAVLVNAGVNVMVTTHSEWMMDALENIVKRSALPPEYKPRKSGKNAYSVALEPEDVGVWQFDRPKHIKGSIVKEIIADDCSGSYLTGFEEVTSDLHNEWASIRSHIENQC